MLSNWLLPFLVLFIPYTLAGEYQPERILDVRQVIKDALNIMKSYPAPTQLIKQTAQQPQTQAQQAQQQPMAAYYAQQQQSYPPPRRAQGVTTYNGGVVSQVDQRFGPKADSQPDYARQMSRWFATPSQQDMEKLFHLPADILHRLAADAGYIPPSEEPTNTEPASYKSSGSDQAFSFNIENHGINSQDLNSFISSVQNPQAETTTEPPVVDVPGPPSITTRQILRDGKYVSIPILIVPQKGGENIYVPFSDMQQLSDAVNKIISTGHYQLTTPKNPDEGKLMPFPVPGPMPTVNVEVEPPMQPVNKVQQKPILKPKNGGSFVQSFDDKEELVGFNSDEESDDTERSDEQEEKATKSPTEKPTIATTTISTTKPTISPSKTREDKKSKSKAKKQDEIVLNGQRYKLVAVETSVEKSVSTETSTSNEEDETTKVKITEPTVVHHRTSESKTFHLSPANETESHEESSNHHQEPQRQYSLKELEELYNKENALATRGTDLDDVDSVSQQRQKIMELREKFARDRLEVAKLTQRTFFKSELREAQKPNEPIDQKCHFLKGFARKYGLVDIDSFARNNCQFIESSFPDLKCAQIAQFIDDCKNKVH